MRTYESETYAEIIEDLIEDRLSLNPSFVKKSKNEEEYKSGKTISFEDLKKR